jgi:hypothetical protein
LLWENLLQSPNIKVNKQQNNFNQKDFQYAFVPIRAELFDLLIDLGLFNHCGSNSFIIAPGVFNRKYLEDSCFSKLILAYFIQCKSPDDIFKMIGHFNSVISPYVCTFAKAQIQT